MSPYRECMTTYAEIDVEVKGILKISKNNMIELSVKELDDGRMFHHHLRFDIPAEDIKVEMSELNKLKGEKVKITFSSN